MLTNLVRAGLARMTKTAYAPMPTIYDGLFPDGTLVTAPTRPASPSGKQATERTRSPGDEREPGPARD